MKIWHLILALFMSGVSFGQNSTTIHEFPVEQDAMIAGLGFSGYTFKGIGPLYVYRQGNTWLNRSLLEFDLSSIPEDATITSANLKIKSWYVANGQDHPFYIERLGSSWQESSVNWNNQPTGIIFDRVEVPHSQSYPYAAFHVFDITNLAQQMVSVPADNHGVIIKLKDESLSGTYGVLYRHSEYGTVSDRPVLEITYSLPLAIKGDVNHISTTGNTGSIAVNISGGTENYTQYTWYKLDNGNLTTIETGTNVGNANVNNLSAGLYLLDVEDDSNESIYKYFLVGKKNVTTSVDFFIANDALSKKYNEDATLFNFGGSGGSTASDYGYIYPYESGNQDAASVMKYQACFDKELAFSSADLYFYALGNHYNNSPGGNSARVALITQNWAENEVTWDSRPSVNNGVSVLIPETVPVSQTRDDIIDLTGLVEYWQQNPEGNYGFDISMVNYNNSGFKRLWYASTDHPDNAKRPRLKLSYTYVPCVEVFFNDTTNLGNIEVNAPAGNLPYKYLISQEPLGSLNDIYNDLVNNGITVDPVTFFQGDVNATTYTFEELASGRYYIGAYDNTGEQILTKDVVISPRIEMFNATNVIFEDNILSLGPNSGATGTLETNTFLPIQEDGIFEFSVVNAGDVILGFANIDSPLSETLVGFEFGVSIDANNQLVAGGRGLTSQTFSLQGVEKVTLSKISNDYILSLDNVQYIIGVADGSVLNGLRIDGVVSDDDGAVELIGVSVDLKPRAPHFTIDYPRCGEVKGTLSVYLPPGISLRGDVEIQPNNPPSGAILIPSFTSRSLSIGTYSLTANYNVAPMNGSFGYSVVPPVQQIAIGFPVEWKDISANTNIVYSPSSVFVKARDYTAGFDATSKAKTNTGQSNWVQFESIVKNSPNQIFGSGTSSWNSQTISMHNTASQIQASLEITNSTDLNQSINVDTGPGGTDGAELKVPNPDGVYRIDENNNAVGVYFNGTSIYSATGVNSGPFEIKILQKGAPLLFNAIASWCADVVSYADLTKKLDGGYYKAFFGELKFIYKEEYNDQDSELAYNVYNELNEVVAVGSGDELVSYGDNRYELDFSCGLGSTVLVNGMYVLEVINEKGEKWYLRFKIVRNC